MFCSECGKEVSGKFCSECGARLEPAIEDVQEVMELTVEDAEPEEEHVEDTRPRGLFGRPKLTREEKKEQAQLRKQERRDAQMLERQRLREEKMKEEQALRERIARMDAEGIAYCPKCYSSSLSAHKKGFGIGKAVVGAALTGGIGLVAGNIGAKKVRVTCMSCGHQFWAGKRR